MDEEPKEEGVAPNLARRSPRPTREMCAKILSIERGRPGLYFHR